MRRSRRKRWPLGAAVVLSTALLLRSAPSGAGDAVEPAGDIIRLGVIATQSGPEATRTSWTPLAEYLTATVRRGTFVIVPLPYAQIEPAVARNDVDLVFVNPGIYIDLEVRYGAERIATMERSAGGGASSALLGSAIIRRADRPGLDDLRELAGKRVPAVHPLSFGGWMAAWREMQDAGLRVPEDLASLEFAGTQDAVIAAVREGRADVGVIATSTLESRLHDGSMTRGEFTLVAERAIDVDHPEYPFRHSTRLYPEDAVAQLEHTPRQLAVGVAVALLQMRPDHSAARALNGSTWTLPGSYQSVRDCLMALRVRPYEHLSEVTPGAVVARYWPFMAALGVLLGCLAVATWSVSRLNRRLALSRESLQWELGERQRADPAKAGIHCQGAALCMPAVAGRTAVRARVTCFTSS